MVYFKQVCLQKKTAMFKISCTLILVPVFSAFYNLILTFKTIVAYLFLSNNVITQHLTQEKHKNI